MWCYTTTMCVNTCFVHAHTHSYSLSHGFWQSLLMMTIFINDKIWKKNEKNRSAINLDYTWNEMETSVHLHTSTLMSHNGQCNSWSRHCSIAFLTVVHSSLAHSTLFGVVLIKCNHETLMTQLSSSLSGILWGVLAGFVINQTTTTIMVEICKLKSLGHNQNTESQTFSRQQRSTSINV